MSRLICFLISILIFFLVSLPKVNAYPQDQLKECNLAAKNNPALLNIPETSIEEFCDCALKAILDDLQEGQASANKCAKAHLNK